MTYTKDEKINTMKASYSDALKQSSAGLHDNSNSYIPFIENFLYALYLCYKELDRRFLPLESGKASKKNRVEHTVLSSIATISKKDIMDILPDVSMTTIEEVLSSMIKSEAIEKIGNT